MQFDLGNLPITMAREMLEWCYYNDIDKQGVLRMLTFWKEGGHKQPIDWTLEITEEQASWIALRWL